MVAETLILCVFMHTNLFKSKNSMAFVVKILSYQDGNRSQW